jgi:hypothetical protein
MELRNRWPLGVLLHDVSCRYIHKHAKKREERLVSRYQNYYLFGNEAPSRFPVTDGGGVSQIGQR